MTKFLSKIQYWLLCLLPLALVTGPFLPDLIAIIIAIFFLINSVREKKWHYYQHPLTVIFFIWCSFLILRSLASPIPLLSLESSLFYWRFGVFALAIWYIVDSNPNIIKFFTWSLLFVFLLVLTDAYIQFFFGNNILGFPHIEPRISGVFKEELILGSFLSRLLPILFAFMSITYGKSKTLMALAMIILVLTDIIIYLSGERSAFFYLILSTIIILLFVKNWKLLRLGTLFISLLLLVVISITNETYKQRMIDMTFKQIIGKNEKKVEEDKIFIDNNLKIRIFSIQHQVIFTSAFRMFLDHPMIGIGPKMFRVICKKPRYVVTTYEDRSIDGCQTHPHNTYIQLLSETGIIGALPVIFGFLMICRVFVRQGISFIQSKKIIYSDFQICLYAAVLITFWPFIPTGNFFHNWLNIIYFLPIGFLIHSYNK